MEKTKDQTWAGGVFIAQGQPRVRLINIALDPAGAPSAIALCLSGNLAAGGGAPTYDIAIGIGESSYNWRALPPPAAGAAYIVLAHTVMVDVIGNAILGSTVWAQASPTDAAPTLTP